MIARGLEGVGLSALLLLGLAADQMPQFRTTVTGVSVHVLVKSGSTPVRSLSAVDFELTDSGITQEIVAVDATTVPLDVSVVARESQPTAGFDHETFVKEISAVAKLMTSRDRLRVVFTSDDHREHAVPIDEQALLKAAAMVDRCVPVYDTLAKVLMKPVDMDRQHVVVLLATDEGSGSFLGMNPVSEIARRSNARLYVVTLESTWGTGTTTYRSFVSWPVCPYPALDWSPPRRTKLRQIELIESYFTRWRELALESKRRLVEIAELTGGSEIRPAVLTQSTSGPVQKALEDVRAGYIIRYTPKGVPDSGWHPITVTIKRPGSYQVQVRPGYQR